MAPPDSVGLAAALSNHAARLGSAGRNEEALKAGLESADLYRTLVAVNAALYSAPLATCLGNVGLVLAELGNREALTFSHNALAIYGKLAETSAGGVLPDLARALCAYARVRATLAAELTEGADVLMTAVTIYHQQPEIYGGHLVAAYRILADIWDAQGKRDLASKLRASLP